MGKETGYEEAVKRIEDAKNANSETLSLSGLKLTYIPEKIAELKNLKQLDLTLNKLSILPDSIGTLTNLHAITLGSNNLTTMPDSIANLTKLNDLVLAGNKIETLPNSFANLINLHRLDLNSNNLKTIPEVIFKLKNLNVLNLFDNNLTMLPNSFANLNNLEALDLSNNHLSNLPESFSKLINLNELYLSGNILSMLPDVITNLTNLEMLYLDHNQLLTLPESFCNLTNLIELRLSDNKFSVLPETIVNLTNLKYLYLNKNQLIELPESFNKLINLEELYLNSNQLSTLPKTFYNLTRLYILYLNQNKLQTLFESLCNLTNLIELNLSNNNFSILSKTFINLTNLKYLYLDNNQLISLPEAFGNLKNLEFLDLSDNKLSSLPNEITKLKKLRRLFLHGNSDLKIPPDILGPTINETLLEAKVSVDPQKTLDYYFRTRKNRRPLNEAKLILVGRGEVGKSSLVDRLLFDTFDEYKKKTEGIQIRKWDIEIKPEEKICLNIWDFGGQEIMHATHQFFLTARSLYLLVVDGRGGMEDSDVDQWLKIISGFAGNSPVIIILNKIDSHPFDLDQKNIKEKYPFVKSFVKTDCFTRTGIDNLLNTIKEETDKLDNLRDNFPAEWFDIKNEITSVDKNFLTFDEFRNFCAAKGESDSQNQNNLASYLHDLGIALNFRDDIRLKDTHILNPHWVTNGIYQILNSKLLSKNKGEIYIKDLKSILDSANYPEKMHPFIFDLMKKFELCFSFPDNEYHYLIPELLDKQAPNNTAEFDLNNCLNFQYNYTVLPNGLLPRFIVKTYTLSNNLPRWRNGVILKFDGCIGLVQGDINEKKIFISISGPEEKRIRLLSIIRSDFERVHNDIKNLNPEELVPIPNYPKSSILYNKLLLLAENNIYKTHENINNKLIEIDVNRLLNGVDLKIEKVSSFNLPISFTIRTIVNDNKFRGAKLFISYSHKDEFYKDEFEAHIKILQRRGLIQIWNDRKIIAGQDWKAEIDSNLKDADIIVLLISADFINSDYCYEIEMKKAMEMHNSNISTVIPVSLRKCNWNGTPFASIQAVPKDALPVALWDNRDKAWTNVSIIIENIAKKVVVKSS